MNDELRRILHKDLGERVAELVKKFADDHGVTPSYIDYTEGAEDGDYAFSTAFKVSTQGHFINHTDTKKEDVKLSKTDYEIPL